MTSAPYDQGMLQPPDHPSRRSRSQDAEWQQIIAELEANNGNLSHDFDMFSPPPTTASTMQHSPLQSIETSAAPQVSATSSSSSSASYSYVQQAEQQYHFWPVTSAPASAFPPAIPEHEQWSAAPHHYNQQPMLQNSYSADMSLFEPNNCHPPQAHHLIAGPSPFLSEASPLGQDFMDEGWDQPDMQQLCLEGNGSDEINDVDAADPCYAQLLWRCLKEAPEHTLSLRELYDWVREHSQKAKDPKNRGWQNSVRHNLSMNAVCIPTTPI